MRALRSSLSASLMALTLIAAASAVWAQDDLPEVARGLVSEGNRHRDAGRQEEAIESYREALQLAPSAIDVYVSLGALLHARGELEASLEVFLDGLEVDPDHRDLLFDAAVVALSLERPDEAERLASHGLDKQKRDVELWLVKGSALARLERPHEALAALQAANGLRPGDSRILFRLGNLHYELGSPEMAVEAYEKAIKKDRRLLRAHYNLGAVLFELERYDEALEAYRVALEPIEKALDEGGEVEAVHARAFLNLGAIYLRRENWGSAVAAYGRAARLDPALAEAHYNQGYAHFATGREAPAEEAYRRALDLDEELPLAYLHLGQIAARRGDFEPAVEWLEAGFERFDPPARLAALETLAESRRRLGRDAAAAEAYREILAARPDDAPALYALGRLERRAGRGEEARDLLERARAARPEHIGTLLELHALARSRGDDATRRSLAEDLLERGDERAELWPVRLDLALLLLRQGATEGARRHLAALERRTSKGGVPEKGGVSKAEERLAATLAAVAAAAAGETKEARKKLRGIADFPPANAALALLDAHAGDGAAALPALERAHAELGESPLGPLLRAQLGQALWLGGRGEQARPHLEAAAADFPNQPGPRVALGDLETRAGRHMAAVEHFEVAGELCAANRAATHVSTSEIFRVALGDSTALCGWTSRALATALTRGALDKLAAAPRNARSWAERALELPLGTDERAVALYVRGIGRLLAGSVKGARGDLEEALAGALPARLEASARNNLGVAHGRLGDLDAARRELEAARRSGQGVEAALNLGILADQNGDPQAALMLYDEYLAAGGPRQEEVTAWAERLRRIYR